MGEGVSDSPYTKISGLLFNNFLSSGLLHNLDLILPPPFHQQNVKKVFLLGLGEHIVFTLTFLRNLFNLFTLRLFFWALAPLTSFHPLGLVLIGA